MNVFKCRQDKTCRALTVSSGAWYEKTKNGDIVKHCYDESMFKKEIDMYLALLDTPIAAPMSVVKPLQITYALKDAASLRWYINTTNDIIKLNLLIHEVFSFLQMLRSRRFVHGNMNVDNVFVKTTKHGVVFCVVDLSKSSFSDTSSHIDQHALYTSMKLMFKRHPEKLGQLDRIASSNMK